MVLRDPPSKEPPEVGSEFSLAACLVVMVCRGEFTHDPLRFSGFVHVPPPQYGYTPLPLVYFGLSPQPLGTLEPVVSHSTQDEHTYTTHRNRAVLWRDVFINNLEVVKSHDRILLRV